MQAHGPQFFALGYRWLAGVGADRYSRGRVRDAWFWPLAEHEEDVRCLFEPNRRRETCAQDPHRGLVAAFAVATTASAQNVGRTSRASPLLRRGRRRTGLRGTLASASVERKRRLRVGCLDC